MKAPPKRRGPLGGGPSPRTRRGRLHRRSVAEEAFCSCGWPFVGKGVRVCVAFGHPEPRRHLRIRDADGRMGWLPVPDAVAKGGR
jgi:hypothetical protein